jgi:hypothetical protein
VCEIFILQYNAKNCISLSPVKAVLTKLHNTNSILLTASTNCKNEMTAGLKLSVYGTPLPYFIYIIL